MYRIFILPIILSIISCGVMPPNYNSLEERLLKVVEISPADGEEIQTEPSIKIMFSKEIDPISINGKSIFVAGSEILTEDALDDLSIVPPLKGEYLLSDDKHSITHRLESDLPPGEYNLIVTDELTSIDGLKFYGNSGDGKPYLSKFILTNSFENSDGGSSTSPVEGGQESGGGDSKPEESTPALPLPSYLVINELLYDAAGSDTKGDIFIELQGEPGGNIAGFYIAFQNGDDGKTYKTISITDGQIVPEDGIYLIADSDTDGSTNVDGADQLENFDPQNGPDGVQLISPAGDLFDTLGYGPIPKSLSETGLPMYEGSPAEDTSSGVSLSRLANEADTDQNSVDFKPNLEPSPGSLEVTLQE